MRRYGVARSVRGSVRSTPVNGVSRLADSRTRAVRFSKRIRRPPPKDASLMGMETERGELDAFLAERGHDRRKAKHLVVMVNGLNGAPTNWNSLKELLIADRDGEKCTTLFYPSHANRHLSTFGGICSCAKRLSEELFSVIRPFPNLEEISFLVHSMGGLISRYACGAHYDPQENTVFGLRPRHYLSIASPHLGCDVEGEAQVPLLGWGQEIPLMGPLLLRPLIAVMAPFVMTHLYRRTGEQLFLLDGVSEREQPQVPLMCRLVQDLPEEGYFLAALKAFQTRTCYANVRQDALVGWANASLRRISELPEIVDHRLSSCVACRSDSISKAAWTGTPRANLDLSEEVPVNGKGRRERVEFMLKRLQSMPWCRIDIQFQGSFVPLLAHTHIQVTRKWIDAEGRPVLRHIAQTFANLDSLISEPSH